MLKRLAMTLALTLAANPLTSQVQVRSQAAEIRLSGRLQTQFNTTSVDGEIGSEFLIRRARFSAEVRVNDFVTGKIEPEYGGNTVELRDAWVRLTFSPALRATFGQFKRPFDLFELTSSTEILVIERAGKIRGVGACAGTGGVCSLSQLTEKLQLSDRDIGMMLDGVDRTGKVGYQLAVTNGTGHNAFDENGAKSVSGRIRVTPRTDLTIGANVGLHDYVDAATGDQFAVGWGADVEMGDYEGGLHLQAGVVGGENWLNPVAGEPTRFLAAQGIVTYRLAPSANRFVVGIEPVARVSYGDPDTDQGNDGGWLLTPGLAVHFGPRNKLAINADVWSPSQGNSEWSFKVQSYLYF